MFKKLTLALLVFSVFLPAWSLQELNNGDFLLSKQELGQLNDQLNLLVKQAYLAGLEAGKEEVKDNPKLCPKDI